MPGAEWLKGRVGLCQPIYGEDAMQTTSATIANRGFHLPYQGEGPLSFQMDFRLPNGSIASTRRYTVGHNVINRQCNGSFSTQPARLVEALMSTFDLSRFDQVLGKDVVLFADNNDLVHSMCNPHGAHSDHWVDFDQIAEAAAADAVQLVTKVPSAHLNAINGRPGRNVRFAHITSADFFFTPLFLFELQAEIDDTGEKVQTGPISVGAPRLGDLPRIQGPHSTMVARLLHHMLGILKPAESWECWSIRKPAIAVELSAEDPTRIIRIGNWRQTYWCNLDIQTRESLLEHRTLYKSAAA